ncbi:hypothetical protein SAMN05414137_11666 [Streptacidiphilus jiangxiensis]|uniref:Uncharacterized protein n=1 Tax=Streptacidiphilus jiangxiensis TaxID=235985 RepID=A0A1H7UNS7_STRJI|nr:hypothetical protein SAMN05414137_11666 [Streptacidiphilus jiangxiensis]
MDNGGDTAVRSGSLGPVAHRARWVAGGLALQFAGIGGPLAYVATKVKHEDVGGLITVATVRLAWHESLHARAGIALLAAGTALFVVGSVLLARPFVRRKVTLLLAVPAAALVGGLVMGAAALLVVVVVLAALGNSSGSGGGSSGGSGGGGSGGGGSGGHNSGGGGGTASALSGLNVNVGGGGKQQQQDPETAR